MANDRGIPGREGPPGREGDIGRPGTIGIQGEKGDPGINSIPSLTIKQYRFMLMAFWFIVLSVTIMIVTPFVILWYPFKTVNFTVPVEITNPDKRVPINGVVTMLIYYEKFVNDPGLTIRTLVAVEPFENEYHVLDSSTIVSSRPKGSGTSKSEFVLSENPASIGKNRKIIFSIYHTLFGLRQMLVQFESEPFEIYDSKLTVP